MSDYRILLIDDDPTVLRTIGAFFTKQGWVVEQAESGEAGLAVHERFEPHVTVVDYKMPGMSGLELLERLKRRGAVVIMLTGHGEVETAVEAMKLGAENFLQKPVDMPHLVAAAEKAAEKATLKREVVSLRLRVPNRRRRTIQAVTVTLLVVAAVVVGLLIGRGQERKLPPIPVPIEDGR